MEYVDVVVMENMLFIVMDNINLLVVNILDKGDWEFIYKFILLDNKIEEVSVIFKYIVKFMLRCIDFMLGVVIFVIINGLKLLN